MNPLKRAKILFFIDGPAPSNEDFAKAGEMAATVVFRNARAVPSEPHSLEMCDGVAGKVPAIYADKYPDAEKAIKSNIAALRALTAKAGDTPAPGSAAEKALKQAAEKEAAADAAAAEAEKQKAAEAKGGAGPGGGWQANKS